MIRGTLVLVVGPSGAGKDTLIDGARSALSGDPRVVFARRAVTRPDGAGGEAHEPITRAEYLLRRDAGAFALCWEANGHAYGIPAAMEADLAAGRTVVANVSRAVIDEARRRFQPVRIVHVTADPAVLAARLAARGRESPVEIAARLARAPVVPIAGPDVVTVANDASAEAGVRQVLDLLRPR